MQTNGSKSPLQNPLVTDDLIKSVLGIDPPWNELEELESRIGANPDAVSYLRPVEARSIVFRLAYLYMIRCYDTPMTDAQVVSVLENRFPELLEASQLKQKYKDDRLGPALKREAFSISVKELRSNRVQIGMELFTQVYTTLRAAAEKISEQVVQEGKLTNVPMLVSISEQFAEMFPEYSAKKLQIEVSPGQRPLTEQERAKIANAQAQAAEYELGLIGDGGDIDS